MRVITFFSQPALLADVFLRSFLPWYYLEKPEKIFRSYLAYAVTLAEIFSVPFLLMTLFSPWKNILAEYPDKGLQLELILESFFLNLTTRTIGAFLRLCAIVIGIAAQIIMLALFAAYIVLWFAFPVVAAFAVYSLFIFFF